MTSPALSHWGANDQTLPLGAHAPPWTKPPQVVRVRGVFPQSKPATLVVRTTDPGQQRRYSRQCSQRTIRCSFPFLLSGFEISLCLIFNDRNLLIFCFLAKEMTLSGHSAENQSPITPNREPQASPNKSAISGVTPSATPPRPRSSRKPGHKTHSTCASNDTDLRMIGRTSCARAPAIMSMNSTTSPLHRPPVSSATTTKKHRFPPPPHTWPPCPPWLWSGPRQCVRRCGAEVALRAVMLIAS